MHVPGLMERVRLVGVDEVYVVLSVDHQRQAVDLLPVLFGGSRLSGVPFVSVEAMNGSGLDELVRRRRGW
jgi:hypothetical protein